MISVKQAYANVIASCPEPETEVIPLQESLHRINAQEWSADRDFPPFDRVCMDGIAVHSTILENKSSEIKIQSTQYAGDTPHTLDNQDSCIEIMTGAHLPKGTDTIIPYEDIRKDGNTCSIPDISIVEKGQNIHRRGSDISRGKLLLENGNRIKAAHINVAATIGLEIVEVYKRPSVAIIATGNELVNVAEKPEPHQIRMSNLYAVQAFIDREVEHSALFHIKDDKEILHKELKNISQDYDILILSGGVSMGKKDYLPEIFQKLGITEVFHKVKQRPGKPFWFGRKDEKAVFAHPGNPVSTIACTIKYVLPYLRKMCNFMQKKQFCILEESIEFKKDLHLFKQVSIENREGALIASPVPSNGSGDFANLMSADGFIEVEENKSIAEKGHIVPFLPFPA